MLHLSSSDSFTDNVLNYRRTDFYHGQWFLFLKGYTSIFSIEYSTGKEYSSGIEYSTGKEDITGIKYSTGIEYSTSTAYSTCIEYSTCIIIIIIIK